MLTGSDFIHTPQNAHLFVPSSGLLWCAPVVWFTFGRTDLRGKQLPVWSVLQSLGEKTQRFLVPKVQSMVRASASTWGGTNQKRAFRSVGPKVSTSCSGEGQHSAHDHLPWANFTHTPPRIHIHALTHKVGSCPLFSFTTIDTWYLVCSICWKTKWYESMNH